MPEDITKTASSEKSPPGRQEGEGPEQKKQSEEAKQAPEAPATVEVIDSEAEAEKNKVEAMNKLF